MPTRPSRPPKHRSRFRDAAAAVLRDTIQDAGGVEVFAIGEVDREGFVSELEIGCRGTKEAVPALLLRPRSGQVVIHNHPSGVLEPSDADFQLAHAYGDEGVGVVIVDDRVERANWVVEPAAREDVPIDRDLLRAFFERDLPRALPGCEARPGQLALALDVADVLDGGGVLVAEAGTGTGKSLAYLVPAALWARANQGKVAISTYTIHLQSQLEGKDIPLMRRAGLPVTAALVKGRNNYVCRRKLGEALAAPDDDGELLRRIASWAQEDGEGTRQQLGEALHADLWERIESDAHQTLRARCPHYNTCFYYEARRRAAASDLLLLNHALLLADLVIKAEGGGGVVPRYDRVILDEGHHLEDAATSATSARLTQRAVSRAVRPLLDSSRRPGALKRLRSGPLGQDLDLAYRIEELAGDLAELPERTEASFLEIEAFGLRDERQLRITPALRSSSAWQPLRAGVENLAGALEQATQRIQELYERLDRRKLAVKEMQPVLDLERALDRLGRHARHARTMLADDDATCRWLELRGRGARAAVVLQSAPIEIGGLLRRLLFDPLQAVAVTSATLRVAGRFDHWLGRHGVPGEPRITTYESPFDYRRQALLGLPRDLPDPRSPQWTGQVGDVVARLVRTSRGSAFVLCTSYRLVGAIAGRLRAEDGLPAVLAQGEASREQLLARYLAAPGSVLVGTDSFWEGVSVVGDDLRLVIIPRLPFRVPTEPVAQARYERLEARGSDPFRELSLPQAILKLRQGFGRLIRTTGDSGAVVVLDRRLHDMWYGRLFLRSLPPARRIVGPTRRVEEALAQFLAGAARG